MHNLGDEGLRGQVERELYDGETLLWVGKPSPGPIVVKNGPSLLPIVFMQVFFFLFIFPGGFSSSLAFLWIFLTIVFFGAAPLWKIITEIGAAYVITDQRALIIKPGLTGRSVRSYSEADIPFVERRERANGTGDIIFDREKRYDRYRRSGRFFGTNTHSVDIGFFGIPDVREVELLMLETFKMSSGGKPKRKTSDLEETI